MNRLFQEPTLHSSSAEPAAAAQRPPQGGAAMEEEAAAPEIKFRASAAARSGGASLGVMSNVSKLFFVNRRASNESMYSTAKSSNSDADRTAVVGERGGISEETFQRQQEDEQEQMDEFKAILAEVRLSNPGMSMAQAQHLALLKISERKGDRNGSGKSDARTQNRGRRRSVRSLVAMDDEDENKNRLLLDRAADQDEDERRARNPNTCSREDRHQDGSQSNTRRANLAPPTAAAAATFLQRNTRKLNPLSQSLPVSGSRGVIAKPAGGGGTRARDRNRPLLKRASVRDPMLQSIKQLQAELGDIDLSDEDGEWNAAGPGYRSGSGSGSAVSPGSSRRGSMFRRRGSSSSRGSGGWTRRRASAASTRSDLSIRSERSLEAERMKRKGAVGKGGGKNSKKKNPIRASAKKLLRLGSSVSSKKMKKDGEDESTGSSQSGDDAHHRMPRRASQAPSLPDIGEDEDYEVPLKSDGDTSQSGTNLRHAERSYSDISIDVPAGDLICRWDNLSRDSIGADSRESFEGTDDLICGWGSESQASLTSANGSSRRHTMATSSPGDGVASPLVNDDENESRRDSM